MPSSTRDTRRSPTPCRACTSWAAWRRTSTTTWIRSSRRRCRCSGGSRTATAFAARRSGGGAVAGPSPARAHLQVGDERPLRAGMHGDLPDRAGMRELDEAVPPAFSLVRHDVAAEDEIDGSVDRELDVDRPPTAPTPHVPAPGRKLVKRGVLQRRRHRHAGNVAVASERRGSWALVRRERRADDTANADHDASVHLLALHLVPDVVAIEGESVAVDFDPASAHPGFGLPVRDVLVEMRGGRNRLLLTARPLDPRQISGPEEAVEQHLAAPVTLHVRVVDGVRCRHVRAVDEAVVARALDAPGPTEDRIVVVFRPWSGYVSRRRAADRVRLAAEVAAAVHLEVRAPSLQDIRCLVPVPVACAAGSFPTLARESDERGAPRKPVGGDQAVAEGSRAGKAVPTGLVARQDVVEEPHCPIVVAERVPVDRPTVDEGEFVPLERPERVRRACEPEPAARLRPLPLLPPCVVALPAAPRCGDEHVEDAPFVHDLGRPEVGPGPAGIRRLECVARELPVDEILRAVHGDSASSGRIARVVQVVHVEELDDERVAVVLARLTGDHRVAIATTHSAPAPSTARQLNGVGVRAVRRSYAAQASAAIASACSTGASATTAPPKPAPVRRAPYAPARSSSSTRMSSSGVDTWKSSRRLA